MTCALLYSVWSKQSKQQVSCARKSALGIYFSLLVLFPIHNNISSSNNNNNSNIYNSNNKYYCYY